MAPILETYKATYAGRVFYFRQRTGAYQGSLDTLSGVARADDDEQDEPVYQVAELINKTILMRLYITYQVGELRKRAQILVVKDRVATALDDLIGENYRSGIIKKVGVKRDATFRI